MKTLKFGFTTLLLAFTVTTFANTNLDMGKKKKHKCNTECTKEKHNYMHGERKHKCTDACHKM